jgi:hypothetical protein
MFDSATAKLTSARACRGSASGRIVMLLTATSVTFSQKRPVHSFANVSGKRNLHATALRDVRSCRIAFVAMHRSGRIGGGYDPVGSVGRGQWERPSLGNAAKVLRFAACRLACMGQVHADASRCDAVDAVRSLNDLVEVALL